MSGRYRNSRKPGRPTRPLKLTKLGGIVERILETHPELTVIEIARAASLDRRRFLKLRTGVTEGNQTTIGNTRDAIETLTGHRYDVEELFDFPPKSDL